MLHLIQIARKFPSQEIFLRLRNFLPAIVIYSRTPVTRVTVPLWNGGARFDRRLVLRSFGPCEISDQKSWYTMMVQLSLRKLLCGAPRICAPILMATVALVSPEAIAQNSQNATAVAAPHVLSSVTVTSNAGDLLESNLPSASGEEVLSAAGTFGDSSRYLQTLPGVAAQSDSSTSMIVRGGNPAENLFLVNGFEVPNLNHIATGSSTGGFASMLDSSLIDSVLFRSSGFSANMADRLSSVTEVNTLRPGSRHAEGDIGIQGAGVLWQKDLDRHTSMLVSAHHGLENLFTKNIGLDGVPDYTNGIATFNHDDKHSNQFSVLLLAGVDSLNIQPCWQDPQASSNLQTEYSGWRSTAGLSWSHTYSATTGSTLRYTDNEQQQSIGQQQQTAIAGYASSVEGPSSNCEGLTAAQQLMTTTITPVYNEDTRDSLRSLNYSFSHAIRSWMVLQAGSEERLNTRNYTIAQPAGTLSPYTDATTRSDAVSMHRNFTTGEGSAFAELALRPNQHLSIDAGLRFQHFAINRAQTLSPRVNVAYRLHGTTFHASLASYAQQPPAMLMLSWMQNQKLSPMHTQHEVFGIDLLEGTRARIGVEVYHKSYRDLPVSTEYAQVNFENTVDSLDQQFVWLPMVSSGKGEAYGAEFSTVLHVTNRFQLQGAAAWSKARFTGLDGVERSGNYEIPVTASLGGSWQMTRTTLLTFRAQASSGRPYTPFDYTASSAQNRGIYDLKELNALHGPTYQRLDVQLTRRVRMMHHNATVYGGVTNALDKDNLMGYYWAAAATGNGQACNQVNCIVRVNQMPTQMTAGARFTF